LSSGRRAPSPPHGDHGHTVARRIDHVAVQIPHSGDRDLSRDAVPEIGCAALVADDRGGHGHGIVADRSLGRQNELLTERLLQGEVGEILAVDLHDRLVEDHGQNVVQAVLDSHGSEVGQLGRRQVSTVVQYGEVGRRERIPTGDCDAQLHPVEVLPRNVRRRVGIPGKVMDLSRRRSGKPVEPLRWVRRPAQELGDILRAGLVDLAPIDGEFDSDVQAPGNGGIQYIFDDDRPVSVGIRVSGEIAEGYRSTRCGAQVRRCSASSTTATTTAYE